MSFGLLNLTKQKKKPRNTKKCHTKRKFRNITKCHNISWYFLFLAVVGPSLIFYYFIFMSTEFSQQILGKKLLLVLKLYIKKKKKTKRQYKKIVHETCSEFWLIQFYYIY